jgi:hydroxymethylglutaryl-CoA reductase (NADPH)
MSGVLNLDKSVLGSGLAFAAGYQNAHVANILSGIFIATGQDVAELVESSMGVTFARVRAEGQLEISVTLPCLEIGTVGGGTELSYAQQSLNLMGCAGSGDPPGTHAYKFAEITAGACLAGELSLLACLAEGRLAQATLMYRHRGQPSEESVLRDSS